MVSYFGDRNHVCGIVYLPGFPGADHRYFWTGVRPLCRIRSKMFPHLSACLLSDPVGRSCRYFFQAIGKPIPAAALTLSRQIILLIPAMLVLGYTMGVEGILWAGPFSDALSGIIALITVKVFWKRIFENKGQKETAGR